MSTSFTQVFGGTTIYPSDVSYLPLALTSDIVLEWPLEATTGNNVVARIIDVTPTGPYTITLPDAMSVGVGQTILFNNLGPDTITVDNAAGNAILSIGAGEQWQCYLISNTTVGGVWRTFRYGAAVAQAQAAALAGAGLIATGSTLAQNYEVVDFSITPYTLTAPDRAKIFVWTGGLGTLNLPTAVAAGDGWFVQVRNGGQGDLTIDPSGSELINAAATLRLQPGDSAVVVSDGIQWYTIGLGQQAVFAFDYTTIAVTGGTYTLAGSELNRIAYKFTGTLTSNVNIVVPATVQQYWVNNATTGAFTLGIKTASGAATLVTQGATGILYCDGTDIISATTSAAFAGIVPVVQGGTGATNAPSALTNLGGTGIGTAVFTATTTAAARSAIAAAASGANSDITSLSGLTTPLSVAQGGTNATTAGAARTSLGAAASGSNADITALTNAAGIQIGAPTAGAQGAGTINATGLFINGVGVGTGSGSVTSVAATVPSFLSVTGSPITTSGTLAISLSGTALPVANGGTGQTTYTDGQLLIGNSTGNTLTKATLTAGSGISITNSAGGITITSTAGGGTVTSVAASGGTTGLSFTGSPITTSGTLTLAGTLAIASGGTGATSASGARLTLSAAGSGANSDITSLTGLTTALSVGQGGTGVATAPSNGQLLIGNGTGYSVATLTAGSGISISNSAGGVTITSTAGGGTVTSVAASGGTTGLTLAGGPITGAGTFTLAGTLVVANGGTGTTTLTGLVKGNGTAAFTAATAGTDYVAPGGALGTPSSGTLTNCTFPTLNQNTTGTASNVTGTVAILNGGTGATTAGAALTNLGAYPASNPSGFTSNTGTVTSVGGTGTVSGLSLSGTVTTSGSLTLGGTLAVTASNFASQSANTFLSAPNGTAGTPTFRAIVAADVPTLNQNTTGTAANVTGTVAVANGGTGATTAGSALTNLGAYAASNPSGFTSNTGTVTSVSGSGGSTGLTLTGGAITTSGTLTLGGTLAVANGGTGGTTQATAQSALGVPSATGSGASGTWAINVSGNAATATSATTATTATTANALNTSNNYQVNSLGVGTAGSGTAGEIRATNNVTAFYSSDARLKENVRPIENALDIVTTVGGKTFDWTDAYIAEHGGEDDYFVRKNDFGVIAQDVEEMFPLAVRTRDDGTLAVDYEKLVAVAFAAIAELKAELDELRGAK
jgi:hypothetical protein